MTAGQMSTSGLGASPHGARAPRRVLVGSAVVVGVFAVALAATALIADNGPQATTPAAAAPVAPAPAAVMPAALVAAPDIYGPAGPYRLAHDQTTARPGTGMSTGRFAY
jgi:hypothetical protein